MSDARNRALAVKQQGEIRRRNWSPSADDSHYKVYRYWQRKSRKYRERENFCHYWRVVLIWGPLRFIGMVLSRVLPVMALGGLIAAFVLFKLYQHFGEILGGMAIIAAGLGFLFLTIVVCMQLAYLTVKQDDKDLKVSFLDHHRNLLLASAVVTAPLILLVTVVWLGSRFFLYLGSLLKAHADLFQQAARWFFLKHLGSPWARPWMVVPATVLALSPWQSWALFVSMMMGVLVGFLACFVLLAYLTDRSGKRREARRQAEELGKRHDLNMRLLTARYSILRDLQKVSMAVNFLDWLEEYRDEFKRRRDIDPLEVKDPELILEDIRSEFNDSEWAVILNPDPLKGPNISRRIMSGLADYLVLIWSVVLVNKWKTCPLVQLPSD